MGEPSAKSPSRELVGKAQALLFTEPAVLFPSHPGKGREEASLATKKPWILFFRHLGLGWCSGVRQREIFWEMTSRWPHGTDSAGPWVPCASVHVPLPCHPLLPSIIWGFF